MAIGDMINYYVYINATGAILRAGKEIEYDGIRTVPDGQTFVELQPGDPHVSPRYNQVNITTHILETKPPELKKDGPIQGLRTACTNAIESGFVSSALGTPYSYGSNATDQINMLHGGDLMCAPVATGIWALTAHTEDQAALVRADFIILRDAMRAKLAPKIALIQAATTQGDIDVITWSSTP